MGKQDIIAAILAEEERTIDYYRFLLSEGVEPELGMFLTRLVNARMQASRELEEFRRGNDATKEITKQINDMFL